MVSVKAVVRPRPRGVQLLGRSTAMDREAATGTMKLDAGILYGC